MWYCCPSVVVDVLRRRTKSGGVRKRCEGTGKVLVSFLVWILTLARPVGLYVDVVSDIEDRYYLQARVGQYHLTYPLEIASPAFFRLAILSRRMPSTFGDPFDLVHCTDWQRLSACDLPDISRVR